MRRIRLNTLATALVISALLSPACGTAGPRPATAPAKRADFHHSDPATIGTTGHPQLLEFFGPT